MQKQVVAWDKRVFLKIEGGEGFKFETMRGYLNAAGWVTVTRLGKGPRAQKCAWKSKETPELKDFCQVTNNRHRKTFQILEKMQKPVSHLLYCIAHGYTAYPKKEMNNEKSEF